MKNLVRTFVGRLLIALAVITYPSALYIGLSLKEPVVEAQSSTVAVVDAFDYEDITVTNASAVFFDSSKYSPSNAPSAKLAVFSVETADVRYKVNGVDPTTSLGHAGTATRDYAVWGINNIRRFRVIAQTATNATLRVTYYR
jgi:hypothetical protein